MTAIIHRSALVFHGHNPASNVAYIIVDHPGAERRVVTWEDVMRKRREHQDLILKRRRHVESWRAIRLSVSFFDMNLMGGWQAFLDGIDYHQHVWIDRDMKYATDAIMRLFPMGLFDSWHEWKKEFAHRFKRRMQDKRPVGVAFLWQRGNQLSLTPHSA